MKGIKGKVAFITGGNAGIGKTTALAFVREGAKVALAARRQKEGDDTVREIEKLGGQAVFIKTDVQHEDQVAAAVEKTVQAFGSFDFAFNNAGILNKLGTIDQLPLSEFMESLQVNLVGVWLCMKYEIRQMLKAGRGVIVNNSSTHGLISTPFGVSPYDASKHGVLGITKSAAMENAKRGIRVVAVCPGEINTKMMNLTLTQEQLARIASRQPMGRGGEPEEVAETVVFLCSDGASFVTGTTLVIDGGLITT